MPVCVRILSPACRCPVAVVGPCAGQEIRRGARIGARMRPEASDDRLHLIAAMGGEGVRIGTAGRALLHRRGDDHAMKTLNVENAEEPCKSAAEIRANATGSVMPAMPSARRIGWLPGPA